MHTTPIIFSIFLLLVAKTAGSHVTVKGLYFLLPVIIIDGLVWIPLPPPSTSNNHLAHTHVCTDQHPNGLLQPLLHPPTPISLTDPGIDHLFNKCTHMCAGRHLLTHTHVPTSILNGIYRGHVCSRIQGLDKQTCNCCKMCKTDMVVKEIRTRQLSRQTNKHAAVTICRSSSLCTHKQIVAV